jgi:hypothetical protein
VSLQVIIKMELLESETFFETTGFKKRFWWISLVPKFEANNIIQICIYFSSLFFFPFGNKIGTVNYFSNPISFLITPA